MVSDWMTTVECAQYRRCAKSTLDKERVRGDGPPFLKIRKGMVRYNKRAVDEWLNAQICRSTSQVRPK
jgi:hypothetical protein